MVDSESPRRPRGVGIDGGQSQLRLQVAGSEDVIVVAGVSHGDDVGARVRDAVIEAGKAGGVSSCVRVVAGLTALPAEPAAIEFLADEIAEALGAEDVLIVDDTVTAHSAAFDGASGIVLVVGTGIACLAVDAANRRIHRASGAGYLIGDEGGAYWIGRQGLACAIKGFDGRGPSTTLVQAASSRFSTPPEDLAVRVHVDERAVSSIAAFAVDVIAAADAGDRVALSILERAADELAACARACAAILPESALGGVTLMGRLVTGSQTYSTLVTSALERLSPSLTVTLTARSPLDGALGMAASDDLGVYSDEITARSTSASRALKRRPVGSAASAYLRAASATLAQAASAESGNVTLAATRVSDAILAGGMIHTFGTGHSHMLAEELFYRAGGLARVDPILIGELMLHESASKSTEIERRPGLARTIVSQHPMKAGDVLIIVSNSGGNSVSVELAQLARSMGVLVIALTSLAHATSAHARVGASTRLHDVADLVLDNHGVVGDAAVSIPGLDRRVGATSTVVGAALLQALAAEVVALLVDSGVEPEVFASSNTVGGDEINKVLLDRYRHRVRSL